MFSQHACRFPCSSTVGTGHEGSKSQCSMKAAVAEFQTMNPLKQRPFSICLMQQVPHAPNSKRICSATGWGQEVYSWPLKNT